MTGSESRPLECELRAKLVRRPRGTKGRRCDEEDGMTRFRRGFTWVVVGLIVFMLVATLVLEGIA